MANELEPAYTKNRERVERDFWDKLKRVMRKLPFLDDLIAVYYCAMDQATPTQAKVILFGALAYFVVPIDFVPDVMAWFGFADDAAVLYAAIRAVAPHIKESHRSLARQALDRLLA